MGDQSRVARVADQSGDLVDNAEPPVGQANSATHKHPKVREWLARHRRRTFHFTPTSCSWLNAVEGDFAKLTRRRLKRGVFKGVVDLQAASNRFMGEHNQTPTPVAWRADPEAIIVARNRGFRALESIHGLGQDCNAASTRCARSGAG